MVPGGRLEIPRDGLLPRNIPTSANCHPEECFESQTVSQEELTGLGTAAHRWPRPDFMFQKLGLLMLGSFFLHDLKPCILTFSLIWIAERGGKGWISCNHEERLDEHGNGSGLPHQSWVQWCRAKGVAGIGTSILGFRELEGKI